MVGNNDIVINKATLMQALQEYFSRVFADTTKVYVTDVKQASSGYTVDWTVSVSDTDPKIKKEDI